MPFRKSHDACEKNIPPAMLINDYFALLAAVNPEKYQLDASPQMGFERARLDRLGAEVACAISLVRDAPSSEFSSHRHPGREEILVLSGVF
jgi:anti-sigma factor ChrR (cupin superfamily)